MNEYIVVRQKGLYKIYRLVMGHTDLYQYAGASFVVLSDAQDFIDMKNGEPDAS